MLTKLDTTRLVPRQPRQPQTNKSEAHRDRLSDPPSASDVPAVDGPLFTLSELIDTLEDRPEIREALRQALINRMKKQEDSEKGKNPE